MAGSMTFCLTPEASLSVKIGRKRRYRGRRRGRILSVTRRNVSKRLLFFAYGVAAYLGFLATFLYAIAFVGGFAVPSALDGPLQTTLPAALAIDCLLLTVFAVQHSVMARRWFKERWTQIVPLDDRALDLCAAAPAWPCSCCSGSGARSAAIWSVENATPRVVLWALFAAGWATVLVVTFLINHFDLFGLRQVWLPLIGRPYTRSPSGRPCPIASCGIRSISGSCSRSG